MNEHKVDYDTIASTYDSRFAGGLREGQHTIPAALHQLRRVESANDILEVGCGTGFWLGSFSAGDHVSGLDLSLQMLARAKCRHAALVCGTAEQIPFPADSFDLIYCVNALHHFVGKQEFIREAARLLRTGGRLAVIGMDPHGQRDTWYIYDYFPGTYELDLKRFPSVPQISSWMEESGLRVIGQEVAELIINPQYGRAVLNHSILRKNGTSQLILLSDEAYARGLTRLEEDLAQAEGQGRTLTFPEEIALMMIVAQRP
jgi:ubiquinone/menaquinone biosynthesis C-methylase UbiE